jgi:xanthine dehydrogenase accessory factor
MLTHRLAELRRSGGRGVLFTVVDGPRAGDKALVVEDGETVGDAPADALGQFDEVVRSGRNRLLELDDGRKVFAEWYGPPPRLFVYGAVDTAEALCRAAKLLGWTAVVADARAAFLTPERIPSADRLVQAWPEEALAEVAPDHQTAIVVLTHDDKFDEPALIGALASEAFYVGALGSRRNQQRRRERLLEAGVDEDALERIHGPCGLDIGADTQEETALSIMAEILAVRAHRSGGPLKQAKQRIHAEVDSG